MKLEADVTLSHFRLIEELGAGGMGVVWRALDTHLDREVALKALPEPLAEDSGWLARLDREVKAVAALNHPNIVTIYSVDQAEGLHFFTMELVEGESLDRLIPATGMPLARFFELALPIADAVCSAHRRGVTHRDLKPANVMVDRQGWPKVLDFGLAKLRPRPDAQTHRDTTLTLTDAGSAAGTLPYMSPEQLRGMSVDPRSDVFSLGILFYEMLAGRRPFRGATAYDLMAAVLHSTPRPLHELKPELPTALGELICQCLEKVPERRPYDAGELLAAMKALARSTSSAAATPLPAAADAAGGRRPARRSVAVLPLDCASQDPEQHIFADGMTEALITDLAKIEGLKVISRTSVMQYKGMRGPLRDIARQLGVETVLEGSVLQAGNRVRVSVQLVLAESDEYLWAERYDRDLEDVLALQSELAQGIARQIDVRLSPRQRARLSRVRRVDRDVYLLDLKGRHFWNRRTEKGFREGLRCFREAIDRDPTYAPAFVGVADCFNMLCNYGLLDPRQGHPQALGAARRALDLDPDLGEAHRALALVRWQLERRWDEAEHEYQRALVLDPSNAVTRLWHGVFMAVRGRFDDGRAELARAQELDPMSLVIRADFGWTYYFEGRHEEAVPHFQRALEIDPDFFMARWFLGEVMVELGEHERAVAELERALVLVGGTARFQGYLGYACGRAGMEERARGIFRGLEETARERYVAPYFSALVCSGLGDVQRVRSFLDRGVVEGDAMIRDVRVDPPFHRFHGEPWFDDVLRRMGLIG